MTKDNNYQSFFNNTADCCKAIIERQTEDLGFNPFALMSDIYKRENFHSDILKAILDSDSSHNEGKLFLQLFYDIILELAQSKKQSKIIQNIKDIYYDRNVEVTRETGRTDIALECKENKWALIIENKLNNANDQTRQLPKYYDYWTARGDKIIAIIYLTPTKSKEYPDKIKWKSNDAEMIAPYFLHMCGYDSNKNCLYNWLKQCELKSKLFNNKAVFEQYSELIKNQAGNDMDKEGYIHLLDSAKSSKMDLGNLREVINQLPAFYATEIQDKLSKKDNALELWIYKKTVVVIDNILLKTNTGDIWYYFDTYCHDFCDYGLTIAVRDNQSKLSYEEALKLINDFIVSNYFELDDDRYYKPIVFSDNKKNNFPTYTELDNVVDIIYSHYKKFVNFIKKIRQE